MVTPNATQLSAMARLFSSSVFRDMAKKGKSPLFSRLISMTDIGARCAADATVGHAFDCAFAILKRNGCRDEYVYRAALTQRILLGKHSLNTACMLSEFRAGTCKADLAILNGTATVYEIKSERDSLTRLANQIHNYKKVFAKIFVIASKDHMTSILETIPPDVGVLELSSRYQISTIREAENRPDRVCPATIFESLRTAEAEAILTDLDVPVPHVPNTLRRGAILECFKNLDPTAVHMAMVETLKRTRDLAPLRDLVECLPSSLHTAALSIQVRKSDHERIVKAISTPLSTAMTWS